MQYRELAKLNSTYLEALPKLIDKKTGRIHADFNQIVTSTGRLSSSNPNLQNIPTKGEFGKVIREAFIAPAGTKILAADYAHIELRIIASLADDEEMIRAFKNGEDIHSQTASKIWGIDLKDVTPEIRRAAKTINFGVTYGMGAKGLAESAEISITEAREFIQKYFEVYEGVSNFLRETREKAYDLGYVETIFGRKRYLPEIFSPIPMVKAEAERMAINMPIQGTAADIIKMAMIKIHRDLPKVSPRSKIILQVHDELVFEVPEKEVKKVVGFIKSNLPEDAPDVNPDEALGLEKAVAGSSLASFGAGKTSLAVDFDRVNENEDEDELLPSAKEAIKKVPPVTGIFFSNPPMCQIS